MFGISFHAVDLWLRRKKIEGRGFDFDCTIAIFFKWYNPSLRTIALGFTQLLTEIIRRTRSIPGGEDGCLVWLTTLQSYIPII